MFKEDGRKALGLSKHTKKENMHRHMDLINTNSKKIQEIDNSIKKNSNNIQEINKKIQNIDDKLDKLDDMSYILEEARDNQEYKKEIARLTAEVDAAKSKIKEEQPETNNDDYIGGKKHKTRRNKRRNKKKSKKVRKMRKKTKRSKKSKKKRKTRRRK